MSVTANNLQDVRRRMATAVEAAQRAPGSVRLIAVTKTFPASAVVEVMDAGQAAFGENYVQEAIGKIAAVELLRPGASAEWHFIGPVQGNKTRAIAEHFDWVHGVDRLRIAERLSAQRATAKTILNVLIEVNLDAEASKSGIGPDDVPSLARAIVALPRLKLRGLMTVPAPRDDPDEQRAVFARLRRLGERLRRDDLPCEHLSMGMSSDFEAAIAEGATMIRIGSAIFGARPVKAEAVTA